MWYQILFITITVGNNWQPLSEHPTKSFSDWKICKLPENGFTLEMFDFSFSGNWLWFSTVQLLCRIVPGSLIIIAVTWKLHIFCLCAINRIVYFLCKYFLFGRWWACSHYIWEWLVGKNMMLFREQGNTIGSCWSVGDNIVHWWGWGWGGKHWSTISVSSWSVRDNCLLKWLTVTDPSLVWGIVRIAMITIMRMITIITIILETKGGAIDVFFFTLF